MLKEIKKRFLIGVMFILPMALTVWILYKAFDLLDSILGNTIYQLLGYKIPGLGIVIMVVVILMIGTIASHFVGKKITTALQQTFMKLPIIKTIYGPLKDIFSNFSNKESNNFKKAVMVNYPKEGSQCLGFITKEHVAVDGVEKTIIFIPTTPNPTSGILVFVGADEYFELDMPVDDALKSIVSLGSVSPERFIRTPGT